MSFFRPKKKWDKDTLIVEIEDYCTQLSLQLALLDHLEGNCLTAEEIENDIDWLEGILPDNNLPGSKIKQIDPENLKRELTTNLATNTPIVGSKALNAFEKMNPIYKWCIATFSWYRKAQMVLKQQKLEFLGSLVTAIRDKKSLPKVTSPSILDGHTLKFFSHSVQLSEGKGEKLKEHQVQIAARLTALVH